MAEEKKVYRIEKQDVDNIAEAIRAQLGEYVLMTVKEMPEHIRSISGGGGVTIDDNGSRIYLKGEYVGTELLVTKNTIIDLRNLLAAKEIPLDIQINVPIPEGYVNTTDGTALSKDLLLGKIAYSQETKLIGTIETYNYSFSIGETGEPGPEPEEPEGLTEQEIEALNNMTTELSDELSISYDNEVLDITFELQDKDLVVNNNMEEVTFNINENKELEVDY